MYIKIKKALDLDNIDTTQDEVLAALALVIKKAKHLDSLIAKTAISDEIDRAYDVFSTEPSHDNFIVWRLAIECYFAEQSATVFHIITDHTNPDLLDHLWSTE